MRWFAGGVVILGCGYLGVSLAKTLELRIHQLELLEQMFRQMEFHIVFLLRPFPEALKCVGESCKKPLGNLFLCVAERMKRMPDLPSEKVFSLALEDTEGVRLRTEEREILEEFFRHIGAGDRENARDGIRITMAKLQILREQAEAEREKDGKLWRSMGFLSGIFIVLLLM